jgi:hypothetical protein
MGINLIKGVFVIDAQQCHHNEELLYLVSSENKSRN